MNENGYAVIVDRYGELYIASFNSYRKLKDGTYQIEIPDSSRENHYFIKQVDKSKIFKNKRDALLEMKHLLEIQLNYYNNIYNEKINHINSELETIKI